MALSPKWEKNYERLVQAHYDDQRQAQIVQRQLRRFRERRHHLQEKIENEGQKTEVWMRLMAVIRQEVERIRRQEDRLTPKNKKLLQQILRQFPRDRFENRVRLMEVSEKLLAKPCIDAPVVKMKTELETSINTVGVSGKLLAQTCKDAPVGEAKKDMATSMYIVPSQQKPCDPRTQPKVDKRLAKIDADLRALRRINKETMDVMADIDVLKSTIQNLKSGTSVKITPYVVRRSFLDLKKAYPRDIKATIAITQKRRKYQTRKKLDIRPPYILEHVPQLQPDTFKFLQMNSKRKP